MRKSFTENLGLKIFALLLAVGIVWIKAQEKINRRNLSDIQIVVENAPDNLYLPNEPWILPTVKVTIQGPRNTIEFVRPNQFSFHIDLNKVTLPLDGSSVNVILTKEMFRTNLYVEDQMRISIVEDSIYPSQVTFTILPWNIEEEKPPLTEFKSTENRNVIPLLRAEKQVSVVVPRYGTSPSDVVVNNLSPEPKHIRVTGAMEAIQQIQSVSTTILDLSMISTDTKPVFLHLQGLGKGFGIWPVQDNIQGATVYYEISKKKRK